MLQASDLIHFYLKVTFNFKQFYTMKNTLFSLSAGLVLSSTFSTAETKINPLLADVASKVDQDGEYIELTYLKDDMKKLTRYIDILFSSLKKNKEDFPQGVDTKKLISLSGFDQMVAGAASSKKVDGAWNNTYYIHTNGSTDGILSIYGSKSEQIEVAKFAPANIDIAVQAKLDLRKIGPILKEVAGQFDFEDKLNEIFEVELPELDNATAMQLIEKADFRVNMLVDVDADKLLPIPIPGVKIPTINTLFRIDNSAWLWKLIEPKLLEESPIPWVKNVDGDVTTLTLPPEVQAQFIGYSLVFRVDKENIWFSTSEELLKDSLSDGEKLINDASYVKTMQTLPKEANVMYYVSHNALDGFYGLYKTIEEAQNETGPNPKFDAFKPLINRVFKDLLSSGSGIAAVVDADEDGFKSVIRTPFPIKNYGG